MSAFTKRRGAPDVHVPGVRALAALALGALVLAAAPVCAQEVKVPEWQAPAGFDDGGAPGGAAKKTGKAQAGKSRQAAPTGGLGSPMRRIERDDIDMTGVGREVRNYGTGVRPMMNGGSLGVGGGF